MNSVNYHEELTIIIILVIFEDLSSKIWAKFFNTNTSSLNLARKDRSKVDSFGDCQPSLSKLKLSKGVRSLQ